MDFKKSTSIIIFIIAIGCNFQVKSQNISLEKKPLKEISLEPEKIPEFLWDQIKKDPFTKEYFGWKLAFIQHPMYLLIDEDRGKPIVGERIPPWGANTASDYVDRVKRNLESLKKFRKLRLNYQWSAMELKSMTDRFPNVLESMRKHFDKGSLDFVDGTYSQAHLQVIGSESNWRQFEYGLIIYKNLFNKKVDVYARQETGWHLQLPQLLNKFDYKYAYLPTWPCIIEFTNGNFELLSTEGDYQPIAGNEFIESVGIDGSKIPTYLKQSAWNERRWDDYQQDLYSGAKIWTVVPDMSEVDENTFNRYNSLFDFVLLGDAINERYQKAPPLAEAKVYTYWSYMEGVWAEELMRKNRSAEKWALFAEKVSTMGNLSGQVIRNKQGIKEIWKTILKSEHHDISWIEVTDLRRKSINNLDNSISDCKSMISEVANSLVEKDTNSMAVFNGLPYERNCLIELQGSRSLGTNEFQQFKHKSLGFVSSPAGGFRSFEIKNSFSGSKQSKLPLDIKTDHYTVTLSKEGLVKQISTENSRKLLNTEDYLGGEISARISGEWVNNRSAEVNYYTGPVCSIIERSGLIGEIPVRELFYFFKKEPFIKVEIEFNFDANEVGNMWIDKTKLNIYYPTKSSTTDSTEIYHDIPFGYVKAKQDRPLFATNWLYTNGLVYVNKGTTKHWINNNVMANVVAWGGNHFSNRMHWKAWTSCPQYDLRLYGKQKIEYYLIPCDRFDAAKIIHTVDRIIAPVYLSKGKGENSFYQVKNKDLKITAVYSKENNVWLRGYKIPSNDKARFRDFEIFNIKLEDIN